MCSSDLGHADEDVCALKSFFQAALDLAGVGHFAQPVLVGLGAVAALVQGAELVHGDDVLRAGGHQHLDDGRTGSAGAVQDDVDIFHLLAHHAQGVDEGSGDDDGRAMLVVVEDGDVQLTLQRLLDLKALRALDVLEVDAAEGGAMALQAAMTLAASWASMQMGKASTPPNSLKSTALPSMTGRPAFGPMSPRPSTAVPLETTATILLLKVYL